MVSTVSLVIHQKPTYGSLSINPVRSLWRAQQFIFLATFIPSLSSNPLPSQPAAPPTPARGQSTLGTWTHNSQNCWPQKFSVWLLLADDSGQKTNCRAFLPWFAPWLLTLLNHIIYLWLIRHREALRQLMVPSQAYLAQLWGNGKCRVALSPDPFECG